MWIHKILNSDNLKLKNTTKLTIASDILHLVCTKHPFLLIQYMHQNLLVAEAFCLVDKLNIGLINRDKKFSCLN